MARQDNTTREQAITLWEDCVRAAIRASDRDLEAYDLNMRIAEFLERNFLVDQPKLTSTRASIAKLVGK